MKFLAVLCLFLSASLIEGALHPALSFPEDRVWNVGKIIQGSPAAEGQFPYQVNLRATLTSGGQSACGGSLISTSWVLTAAHCLTGVRSVTIRLGSVNFATPQLTIESTQFIIHPNYNSNTLNNDLGLVNLGRNVALNDRIQTVALPRLSQVGTDFAGRTATATGWGYTSNSGPISNTMNWVNLNIITNARCTSDYNTAIIVSSTICAVGITSTAQSTCSGDSGGALTMVDDNIRIQVGVVSFVSSLGCSSGRASGYVRPHHFWNWINSNTGIPIRQ